MKTVWVFPGQGSQALGMEADLTTLATERWTQAQEILGWSVAEICRTDIEKLNDTLYTQPCLYVIESILVDLLRQRGTQPDLVAGHSLGEYVALYAAGVFDFATGLRLVQRRAELMAQAAGGKMVAIIGFDRPALKAAIAEDPDVVLANDNSAAQVVISGTPAAVDTLISKVKIKKAIPIAVSGAFHSPLMAEAATEFNQLLTTVEFADAQIPVLSNVDPLPTTAATEIKERLSRQMTGAVRWLEIGEQFTALDVQQAVEVGPGKVLVGLLKRTCPKVALANVGSAIAAAELPIS